MRRKKEQQKTITAPPKKDSDTLSHRRLRLGNTCERLSERMIEFDDELSISEHLKLLTPNNKQPQGVLTASFCERVSGCSPAWLPEGVRARPRTRRHFTDRLRSTHRQQIQRNHPSLVVLPLDWRRRLHASSCCLMFALFRKKHTNTHTHTRRHTHTRARADAHTSTPRVECCLFRPQGTSTSPQRPWC